MKLRPRNPQSPSLAAKALSLAVLAAGLSGCAAELKGSTSSSASSTPLSEQNLAAAKLSGATIRFHFSDFYSLTNPNPSTSCAGDANAFFDPLALVLPSYPSGYTGYQATTGSTGPLKLEASLIDPTTTIRPSFIKNVSVNLTNANAPSSLNAAQSCSLGSGTNSPPVSNCSTFDFGAIGGLPTNMGGTLVLIGGVSSVNYQGQTYSQTPGMSLSCGPAALATTTASAYGNTCGAQVFGLGLNTLPSSAAGTSYAPGLSSSTEPISIWSNISAVAGYSGPLGAAGSSATFESSLQEILLFGGAAPLAGLNPTGAGPANYDTWIFDIQEQKWTQVVTKANIDTAIQRMFDCAFPYTGGCAAVLQPQRISSGRSVFGYVAVQGMALTALTTGNDASIGDISNYRSLIDTTDRLVTVGGLGNCNGGYCTDSRSFNPTFGPEYREGDNALDTLNTISPILNPMQWIDSSPDQLISNSYNTIVTSANTVATIQAASDNANFLTTKFPTPNPTPTPLTAGTTTIGFGSTGTTGIAPLPGGINFGAMALANNSSASIGVGPSGTYSVGTVVNPGAGYVLAAGGFYGWIAQTAGLLNKPDGSCTNITQCGGDLQMALRRGSNSSLADERGGPNFSFLTNQIDIQGTQIAPVSWRHILDSAFGASGTPWFGGGSLIKGINMVSSASNEAVFFGGSDCRDYLIGSAGCTGTPISNPGRYWNFGTDPAATVLGSAPTITSMGGTVPTNAGMAAARGLDLNGNPIVVAWGGMGVRSSTGTTTLDTTGNIYYLYKNTVSGLPSWGSYTIPLGAGPSPLANAALVYSHITGKFYLFGGYNANLTTATSINGTVGDTWELSVSSSTPGCGSAVTNTCNFSWRLLNASAGMSCYPNCPPVRRSHRIAEANYNYFNAPNEPSCSSNTQPCSFGIFMTGGTPDGVTVLSDRWMFDPTANGGNGHWQSVGDFPPRVFGAMASAQYTVPASNGIAHRAVLFGGETAMEDPIAITSGYFVPPTLGDTWMFDYLTNSWNRVKLYGRRYESTFTGASNLSASQIREASYASDTTSAILSPPPLSGALMVTRTALKTNHILDGAPTKLAIPEIYLFGGRGKDGMIQPLSKVYKFCAGSTGEKPYPTTFAGDAVEAPDDATCDAYDRTNNLSTQSPNSGYTGRWLYKTPPNTTQDALTNVNPATLGAYLGAATYDSTRDIILAYGGINTPNKAVTDTANLAADATGNIQEYIPPSSNDYTNPGITAASGVHAGYWRVVGACQESPEVPAGRYGHSMGFDTVNRSVFISGGYALPGTSSNGALLTQSYQSGSTVTPEVWSAIRFDAANSNGIPSRGIPSIIEGDSGGQFPCYYWSRVTNFGNSVSDANNPPPTAGVAHAASVYIPTSGFNTGYYTLFDQSCVGAGTIASSDSTVNKLLIGGAYFDIDRSQLGAAENLILNLTFLPMGPTNQGPDQTFLTAGDSAVFRVNLIRTGQTGDLIRQVSQPRDFTYASTDIYPQVAQNIAVISPPNGQIRQEQIFIPLSIDQTIDRIHVERYSGSGILIDATLMRTGPR